MFAVNETHDPELRSWIESANDQQCGFPIQNLPFAVFCRRHADEAFRGGVAIGDQIVDLAAVNAAGLFDGLAGRAAAAGALPELNELMAMGAEAISQLRLALSRALRRGAGGQQSLRLCLTPQAGAEYAPPCRIGDFTDFYTSIHHATSVGKQFRPDNPLLPNYKWVPIGYHGRSSSIVVSGRGVARPVGQIKKPEDGAPTVAPCARLDHELELGIFVGAGNPLGKRIDIDEAESHVFGICLLNDWSARDIQSWEYQPLGPFLAKSFASTISPWIVTLEALAPYRRPFARPAGEPPPLPYLDSADNSAMGAIDIELQAFIETKAMRARALAPELISSSNFRHSWWTVAQLVAHHTLGGCNLRPGDLLGSGTQSGPGPNEGGSMLELSRGGQRPLQLRSGESRGFLHDGDTVILRAHCGGDRSPRIGFGEAAGTVLPARTIQTAQDSKTGERS